MLEVFGEGVRPRRGGFTKSNRERPTKLIALATLRGGFTGDLRELAAWFYVGLLKLAGLSPEEVETAVIQFGREHCRPSLPPGVCRSKVANPPRHNLTTLTIVERLDVTQREADATGWRAATKHRSTKTTREAERHRAIQRVVRDGGGVVPSTRKMREALTGLGITVKSNRTVYADYQKLGLR